MTVFIELCLVYKSNVNGKLFCYHVELKKPKMAEQITFFTYISLV